MIQMTQAINTDYATHVKGTGVTCWTCHRGNAIPVNYWAAATKSGRQGDDRG